MSFLPDPLYGAAMAIFRELYRMYYVGRIHPNPSTGYLSSHYLPRRPNISLMILGDLGRCWLNLVVISGIYDQIQRTLVFEEHRIARKIYYGAHAA